MSYTMVTKISSKTKNEKTPMDETEKEDNRRRLKLLGRLSRAPGKCPVSNCDQVVFPSGLLVHLLHKHTTNPNTTVVVLYDEQRLRRTFNPDSFAYDEPQALTILLYAGTQGKPHTRPARRYLSFSNCGFLHNRRQLEHHLPLVLMICKTSLFSMLPDRKNAEKLEEKFGSPEDIVYVIWLVAPVTSSRMIYTLTIFDRYYIQSRSVIRKARNYVLPQHPKDFLSHDTDYLLLRHEEAMDLMSAEDDAENKTPYIALELLLQEEPLLISSRTPPSASQLLSTYKAMRLKMPRTKLELHRDSRGRLSLNRKPLSNPMIVSAVIKSSLAYPPESGGFLALEQRTRISPRAKVRTTEEYSVDSDVTVAPNGDTYQEKLDEAKSTEVEVKGKGPDILALEVSPTKLQRKKKAHSRYSVQLKDELVKYVVAAERRKDKAQQLLKSMESYLEACQESDEEDASSELKHFLKEFAVERSLGGKDLSLRSINKRKRYVDCKKKRRKKSESQSQKEPSESREKAGSSREAAPKCLEEIQESSIRDLKESIMNLRVPITNEVLQTVKEAVVNSVKDAVRKVAEETIITKLDVASELELEKGEPEVATEPTKPETQTKSVPEMEPQDEAKPETEAQIETEGPPKNYTKIPGVTVNIEMEFASDCDLYSERN
ncbi:uncharacterized protein LOC120455379 [Drosophila santomea]|uniref:uncharacterized protein LOC120455379 n=1 Tax=Drosophila santomea TaxID=129105 RepID=UPI00195300A3|nr:uncharacterized protein LOC120455379 [Drosophila santomea]